MTDASLGIAVSRLLPTPVRGFWSVIFQPFMGIEQWKRLLSPWGYDWWGVLYIVFTAVFTTYVGMTYGWLLSHYRYSTLVHLLNVWRRPKLKAPNKATQSLSIFELGRLSNSYGLFGAMTTFRHEIIILEEHPLLPVVMPWLLRRQQRRHNSDGDRTSGDRAGDRMTPWGGDGDSKIVSAEDQADFRMLCQYLQLTEPELDAPHPSAWQDRSTWLEVPFYAKPQAVSRPPPCIWWGHLPRLDWRLWFVPLRLGRLLVSSAQDYDTDVSSQMPVWFQNLVQGLYVRSPLVLELLNPQYRLAWSTDSPLGAFSAAISKMAQHRMDDELDYVEKTLTHIKDNGMYDVSNRRVPVKNTVWWRAHRPSRIRVLLYEYTFSKSGERKHKKKHDATFGGDDSETLVGRWWTRHLVMKLFDFDDVSSGEDSGESESNFEEKEND
eukprot:Platyproteum_vivax@DN577_c0_g1_i1.p1